MIAATVRAGRLGLSADATGMAGSAAAKAGLVGVRTGRPLKVRVRRGVGRRDGGDEGVGGRRTSVDLGADLAHHIHVMRQQVLWLARRACWRMFA
jgi:hypothetical protein